MQLSEARDRDRDVWQTELRSNTLFLLTSLKGRDFKTGDVNEKLGYVKAEKNLNI